MSVLKRAVGTSRVLMNLRYCPYMCTLWQRHVGALARWGTYQHLRTRYESYLRMTCHRLSSSFTDGDSGGSGGGGGVSLMSPPHQSSLLSDYGKHTSSRVIVKGMAAGNTAPRHTDTITSGSEEGKLTLWQRFKVMYRQYWYVLVPVHLVTSTVWVGAFYLMVRSGFDITHYLAKFDLHIPENAGYLAVVYAMYKLATPARYFITVTGTTVTIHYLRRLGIIKPVPSRVEIVRRYKARRERLKIRWDDAKDRFQKIREKQG